MTEKLSPDVMGNLLQVRSACGRASAALQSPVGSRGLNRMHTRAACMLTCAPNAPQRALSLTRWPNALASRDAAARGLEVLTLTGAV